MDNRPIGVFDSGLGGLTGVRELRKRCLLYTSLFLSGSSSASSSGSSSSNSGNTELFAVSVDQFLQLQKMCRRDRRRVCAASSSVMPPKV